MSSPPRGGDDAASPPVIDTGDLVGTACDVCQLGPRRPASPAAPRVRIPPPGGHVSSVRDLVQDANILLDVNRALRRHAETLSAYNAGLAVHAATLHDRNLAILRRGREGYELGVQTVDDLHVRMEAVQRENTRLVDVAASFKDRASKADHWEHSHRVLEKTSYEDYCALQDTLTAAQSHAADLESRLATRNSQISDLESQLAQERAHVAQPQMPSISAAYPPIVLSSAPSQTGSTRDGPEQVPAKTLAASVGSQASLLVPSQLDDAVQARDDALNTAADQAKRHAAVTEELRTTRNALAQSRSEAESVRLLNAPLQDDLRRVNALLTAHAEERKRDLERTRVLEDAVSTAEAARVVAQADRARAEVSETQAVARSDQYRRGWLDIRRATDRERAASVARVHRLSTRVIDLEGELDRSRRDLNDRAAGWRRLLRDARRGRETARRVSHALSARLAASVDAAGGRVDVGALVRDLEVNIEAVVASDIPLPPEDPDQAREDTGAVSSVSTASPSSPSVGPPQAPSRRPSPGSPTVTPSDTPSAGSSSQPGAPSPRRSSRPSTVADTAAYDNAATQRHRPASVLSSASSDSDDSVRGRQTKRRRIRRHVSSSSSSPPTRPVSHARPTRSASPARSTRSARSASPAYSTRLGPASPHGSATNDAVSGSSSSSSGSSSSSEADSGSDDDPAAPFFAPAIPPAGDRHVWGRRITAPWPRFLRRLRLTVISVRQIRSRCLPPPAWIYPTVPTPEPATWNVALVTPANVDALYATRPWRYLMQLVVSFTFATGDASFQRFLVRYRVHLEHWAQAYWESTHELVVNGSEWDDWRRRRNSRRSHAGGHFTSVVQLVVELFRERLADMDLFLDPLMLHFSPSRSGAGRWYPGLQHATLQDALDDIDAQEPWRRFFRSPLTVAEMEAGVLCTVSRAHPAFSVPRLENKFIQEI